MNIAYVHSGSFPSKSPSQTFVLYNAVGLAKSFDKVYLFLKKNENKPAGEIFEENMDFEKPDNLIFEAYSSIMQNSTNRLVYRKYYKRLSELCEKKEIDAIITRRNTFLPFLAKLKAEFNIPTFFETHDFYADLSKRDDVNANKKKKEEKFERNYIPEISGVFCLQDAQMELYKSVFPDANFHLLRTGLIPRPSTDSAEKKYIAYIGSFGERKGVDTLLDALQYIEKEVEIALIGGKSEEEIAATQSAIERAGEGNRAKITGWLTKRDLNRYLERTLLGILPLRDSFFNRHLTSPLKLFDYYAYSIPVVASDLPSLRALIKEGETGLFFEPQNPKELATKINRLLSDEKKLKEMRENVAEYAQELTWDKRGEKTREIIGDYVNREKSGKQI